MNSLLVLTLLSLACPNVLSQTNLFKPLLDTGINWQGCTLISASFPVMWTYNSGNDTITLGVSSSTTGYLGIGFNSLARMLSGDAMIGRFQNGTATVDDYYLTATQTCMEAYQAGVCVDSVYPSGVNNKPIIIASGRGSSSTYFVYNRFRVGPDASKGYDITVPTSGTIEMIWAIGATDTLEHHQDRGIYLFSLLNQAQSCPSNCSGHGKCLGSCCICNAGYSGDACANVGDLLDSEIKEFASAVVQPTDYEFGGNLDQELALFWNVAKDSEGKVYLDVGLRYDGASQGTIGLGCSSTDMVFCKVSSSSSYQISDSDLLAATATTQDNHVDCKWRRYFSGDQDNEMKCLFSHSSDPNNKGGEKGRAKINFITGEIVSEP